MYNVDNKKISNFGHAESTQNNKQYKEINKLFEFIERQQNQIRRLQTDVSLSTGEKQQKIARCLDNIANYENQITQALEGIKHKNPGLYETFMSQLEKQR